MPKKALTRKELKDLILAELPKLLKRDKKLKERLVDLLREDFADKRRTEDRFELLLEEIRQLRIESQKKWEESQKKWEESQKKWEENQKKWEENQKIIWNMLKEIKTLRRRYEVKLGAIGARWGARSEASLRKAMKRILEESFPVKVERYLDFDKEGVLFGKPAPLELDLIIRDGEVIVAEIKSSVSTADVAVFVKKVELYERKTGIKPKRKLIISPMVEPKAEELAKSFEIEVCTYPDEASLEKQAKVP